LIDRVLSSNGLESRLFGKNEPPDWSGHGCIRL
jgi:hypothetical protein